MEEKIIKKLIALSKKAYKNDEVPIGALIVKDNQIIASGYNQKIKTHECMSHAEIIAIRKASKKLKDWRLNGCKLYVTLEPCPMCKEVIKQSRINEVYFLLKSNFDNEESKKIEYIKLENSCDYEKILKSFFKNKRCKEKD